MIRRKRSEETLAERFAAAGIDDARVEVAGPAQGRDLPETFIASGRVTG